MLPQEPWAQLVKLPGPEVHRQEIEPSPTAHRALGITSSPLTRQLCHIGITFPFADAETGCGRQAHGPTQHSPCPSSSSEIRCSCCLPSIPTNTRLLRLDLKTRGPGSQVPCWNLCSSVTWDKSLPLLGLNFPVCVMGNGAGRSLGFPLLCQSLQNSAVLIRALRG